MYGGHCFLPSLLKLSQLLKPCQFKENRISHNKLKGFELRTLNSAELDKIVHFEVTFSIQTTKKYII
jgi:hypothetical protein